MANKFDPILGKYRQLDSTVQQSDLDRKVNDTGDTMTGNLTAPGFNTTQGGRYLDNGTTRLDLGYDSWSGGAAMEFYKYSDPGKAGRVNFVIGGSSGTGGYVVTSFDGWGYYFDILTIAQNGLVTVNGRITGVATPTGPTDAVNKAYADTASWATVPATATSIGTAGQRAYDANYLYVCTATNTWKRTPLTTW